MKFADTDNSTKIVSNIHNRIKYLLGINSLADRKIINEALAKKFSDESFETPLKKQYQLAIDSTRTPQLQDSNFLVNNTKDGITFTGTGCSNSNSHQSHIRAFPNKAINDQSLSENLNRMLMDHHQGTNSNWSLDEDFNKRGDGVGMTWIVPSFNKVLFKQE